ncbi:MAG TPA: hypothetical protein VJ978_01510, partial [Nitriliruptoraceae bacterium]|nr:hypothetical protein [Nitriliruptoraceae bacterium]
MDPPPDWPEAATPPPSPLDPPTLDLGAPPSGDGADVDGSAESAPEDSSSGGQAADPGAAGEAASGEAGHPPPPVDPSDPPGPPPIPFTPQGSSGGSGRTWVLVGVALLFVVGIGALAVALVAGGSD